MEWLALYESKTPQAREEESALRLETYRQRCEEAKAKGWKDPETA